MRFPWSSWGRARHYLITAFHIDPDTQEKLCVYCWGLQSRGWSDGALRGRILASLPGVCIDYNSDEDMEVARLGRHLCKSCFDKGRRLPEREEERHRFILINYRDFGESYQDAAEQKRAVFARRLTRGKRFFMRLLNGKLPRTARPIDASSPRYLPLMEAFSKTNYHWYGAHGRSTIRVGENSEAVDALLSKENKQTAAFLTAYNPDSYALERSANERRNADLFRNFTERRCAYRVGFGAWADDPRKGEESFLIIGIDREEATKLASKFGQLAFVFVEFGKPAELVVIERSSVLGRAYDQC